MISISFSVPLKGLRIFGFRKGSKMVSVMRIWLQLSFVLVLLVVGFESSEAYGYGGISHGIGKKIDRVNKMGPYLGIVVPNSFEMDPLLQSPSFVADEKFPFLDFSGRRFRFGELENEKVIVVMTGLSMLNAGIATQLLLSLFKVKGVVHYGIAGNANPNLQVGDVTVPQYWAHTGLWNWQRYGDGQNDELALESNGDYTRNIGYLRFSDYNNVTDQNGKHGGNFLNNVWHQPEEIFPVNGTPEVRQHAFWVPVDKHYFTVAKKLKEWLRPPRTWIYYVEALHASDNSMDELPGALGTSASLALRMGQTVFSSASLLLMCVDVDFYSYTSFCYLVTVMGLVIPWSLTLLAVDACSVFIRRLPRQPRIILVVIVGDLVLSFLLLAAASSTASVTDILLDAGRAYCPAKLCGRYQLSAAMAFLSWSLTVSASLLNLWILPSL